MSLIGWDWQLFILWPIGVCFSETACLQKKKVLLKVHMIFIYFKHFYFWKQNESLQHAPALVWWAVLCLFFSFAVTSDGGQPSLSRRVGGGVFEGVVVKDLVLVCFWTEGLFSGCVVFCEASSCCCSFCIFCCINFSSAGRQTHSWSAHNNTRITWLHTPMHTYAHIA